MELVRISLAGIMALLVSMPLAVCKEDCVAQASSCEQSCCGEHQMQAVEACDCGCIQVCPKVQFESRDALPSSSEVNAPDVPEQPAEIDEAPSQAVLGGSCAEGANHLRAPPDPFAGTSRQIIHCVYRW